MKHIIEFNLPDDKDDLEIHLKAVKNSILIDEIWEKIFRPAHKHGYGNEILDKLLEDKKVIAFMSELSDLYTAVLRENQ